MESIFAVPNIVTLVVMLMVTTLISIANSLRVRFLSSRSKSHHHVAAAATADHPMTSILIPQGRWMLSLPFVGEGLQLWWQGVHGFLYDSFTRFGELYRMSVFGYSMIVVNSTESIKFVMSTSHNTFQPNYPQPILKVFGVERLGAPDTASESMAYFRKVTMAVYSGTNLRKHFLTINRRASEAVDSWMCMGKVNISDEIDKFVVATMSALGWTEMADQRNGIQNLVEEMTLIADGLSSGLPINLPPFPWYKAIQARESFTRRIQECMMNRQDKGYQHEDLLGFFMEHPERYSSQELRNLVLLLFFAAFQSIRAMLPWVIKHLHDNPHVREYIKAEHEQIHKQLVEDESLNWFSMKTSMPLTLQVINEVLRLHSFLPAVSRRAMEDVKYKGFLIPRDSVIVVSTASVHMDPKIYPDPTTFDPFRFQKCPTTLDTFLPFGSGPYMCPGQDMARIGALFLVHQLVTKCRWEDVGNKTNEMPKTGFSMTLYPRDPSGNAQMQAS